MRLIIKHFVVFVTITVFASCNSRDKLLVNIEGKQLLVGNAYAGNDSILNYITPYRLHIDKVLDSTLCYASLDITKHDGKYNSTAGNLIADIIYLQSDVVFKSLTDRNIDIVLLNYGGIRSGVSKGNVSARTAYELMPFENTIVVAELPGSAILEMVNYIIASKVAHPISGMQIILDKNNNLSNLNIQGLPFDVHKTYSVATSNYLINGGDKMLFFKEAITLTEIDYKIRNAIIDYFSKVDTLSPIVDQRFYTLK